MKKHFLLLTFILLTIVAGAQVRNINPDPDGDPWYVGGLRELTTADYEMLSKIPQWTAPYHDGTLTLPTQVDNTGNVWFRPIFNQSGGSCGQASGIGYNFTYEIDYARQVPANTTQNQYPTHFAWNFLNGGVGNGSWYFDGWLIVREAGCPTVYDYGGMSYGGETRWMSGYDLYENAMYNRVLDFYTIDVTTREGIETLKQWLYSRDGGTLPGGLANFGAGITAATITTLPYGTHNGGKTVVTSWGPTSDHAMTFVGYDDEIVYDFNNDGQYTDDIDINGDGVVDMRDCEIGGLIMANSWGASWGFQGKAYVMYKLLADPMEQGGIWANMVHLLQAKPDGEPLLTIKTTIKHTSRNKIKIMAGIATDPEATRPEHVRSFPLFNYQGGDFYMKGGSSNSDKTIEIGLDITDLLSWVEPGEESRIFLQIIEQDPYQQGQGEIVSMSVIDYNNGQEETISDMQNINIANNDTTLIWTNAAINFDKVAITTEALPDAAINFPYLAQLEAAGGTQPYAWSLSMAYHEEAVSDPFPAITTNELTPTNDDDGYAMLTLPFDFMFYGETYNELTILTDGAITFDGNFAYVRDDGAIIGNKCITAYCADLMMYPALGDGIFYEGDEASMTIRWKMSKWDMPAFDVDVAVALYPDGRIYFFYNDGITPATDWSAGVSTGDGNSFLIASVAGQMNIPANYAALIQSNPFPAGMEITSGGLFSGTPVAPEGTIYEIPFKVTGYDRISATKMLTFSALETSIATTESKPLLVEATPNPATDNLTIRAHKAGIYHFVLLDISGRKVANLYGGHLQAGAPVSINLSGHHLQAGVYLLQHTSTNGHGAQKIVVR
ncbi:MAG: T9SS type A sorting domain-containing protein [Bacteroidales bacterium]|nr:T9SS type A sorting domain-containing protein [Bacteroidales bacterium]